MKTKDWMLNAIIAAVYVVLTGVLAPLSFGAYQFRVGEMLNHLAVFQKKYIVGILAGVFISNFFFSSFGIYDLFYGVAHSVLSLLFMLIVTKKVKSTRVKMVVNTLSFAAFSFMIAIMLNLFAEAPFWFTYFTVAVGELAVMFIGIPLIESLDKRIGFAKRMQ